MPEAKLAVSPTTRAQAAGRPQTRLWAKRLVAAQSDDAERERMREEADRYLAAADATAKRKSSGAGASGTAPRPASASASRSDSASRSGATDGAWDNNAPEIVAEKAEVRAVGESVLEISEALGDVDWLVRAEGLRVLARVADGKRVEFLAEKVAKCLGDLRSALVSVAADAVVACAKFADVEAAVVLVEVALSTATKTKAVMAEAGRRAAVAVLCEAPAGGEVWAVAGKVGRDSYNGRARETAVGCFSGESGKVACAVGGEDVFKAVLESAAVDKIAGVREGAKEMVELYKTVHGEAELEKMMDALNAEAKGRLAKAMKSVSAVAASTAPAARASQAKAAGLAGVGAKPGGNMSMKEMIRQKRLETAKAKAAENAGGATETPVTNGVAVDAPSALTAAEPSAPTAADVPTVAAARPNSMKEMIRQKRLEAAKARAAENADGAGGVPVEIVVAADVAAKRRSANIAHEKENFPAKAEDV